MVATYMDICPKPLSESDSRHTPALLLRGACPVKRDSLGMPEVKLVSLMHLQLCVELLQPGG